MLDIGPGELLALAVIALLVLGPDKLPKYAADAARFLRQLRQVVNNARSEVQRELGPELGDLTSGDLNPRSLMRKHLLDPDDVDLGLDGDRPPQRSRSATPPNGASRSGGSVGGSAERPALPPPYDADAT